MSVLTEVRAETDTLLVSGVEVPKVLGHHRWWWVDANCSGMDTAIFVEAKSHPAAMAACAGCSVRWSCLADAFRDDIELPSDERDVYQGGGGLSMRARNLIYVLGGGNHFPEATELTCPSCGHTEPRANRLGMNQHLIDHPECLERTSEKAADQMTYAPVPVNAATEKDRERAAAKKLRNKENRAARKVSGE